jgi:hypothetical protein
MCRSCGIAILFMLTCAAKSSACEINIIQFHFESVEDHLFWYEFWLDDDLREAKAELDYALAELKHIRRVLNNKTCMTDKTLAALRAAISNALSNAIRKKTYFYFALRPW